MAKGTDAREGASPEMTRRLATIVSADVAGYSRMMGENEEATVHTLRGHRAVFEALLKQHHGRVFNTAGDAILAEFPSAVEAVRCATEIQSALQTRNEHLPPDQKMLFRMGINVGDVVVQDGDLLGDGVNVAARIQTVAEPGGICISGSVYDQIQNKLSLQFRALGNQKFKNIALPIRTFTITQGESGVLPAAAPWFGRNRGPLAAVGAIVVCVLAAGGYWIYRDNDTKRQEQSALRVQLANEKRAAEEAQRAAEELRRRASEAERNAERERLAADSAKREATLQAKAQSVDEAQRRADAERKQFDADKRRLEAERQASVAALKVPATTPPASPRSAGNPTDGTYTGQVCNVPADLAKKTCWSVALEVQGGAATGAWQMRRVGKAAYAHATVAPEGTVKVTLDGWRASDGTPLAGAMNGHLVDNHIDVDGRWANGAHVEGHWTRSP